MADATLSHPDLPGQDITVAEASVWHHERAGWRRKEAEEPSTDSGSDTEENLPEYEQPTE